MQFRFLKLQLTCRSKAILSALRDAGQHIAVLRPSKRKTTSSERPNSCLFLYLTKEGAMENYFGQVQGSLNLRSVARQGKGEKDTGQFYLSVYHVLSVSLWWERKKEERGIRNDQSKVKSQDEITTNAELRGNTGRWERKKTFWTKLRDSVFLASGYSLWRNIWIQNEFVFLVKISQRSLCKI